MSTVSCGGPSHEDLISPLISDIAASGIITSAVVRHLLSSPPAVGLILNPMVSFLDFLYLREQDSCHVWDEAYLESL